MQETQSSVKTLTKELINLKPGDISDSHSVISDSDSVSIESHSSKKTKEKCEEEDPDKGPSYQPRSYFCKVYDNAGKDINQLSDGTSNSNMFNPN